MTVKSKTKRHKERYVEGVLRLACQEHRRPDRRRNHKRELDNITARGMFLVLKCSRTYVNMNFSKRN
jgi:hypothetical protein